MSEREATPGGGKFDPTRYLRQLRGRGGGNEYLDVKWRLVWLRSEHPDAQISTEHVSIAADSAVFKATVAIPGGGSATGYGSETAQDFNDFIEKAETKALGRALLALGYGTQFAQDFSEEDGATAGAGAPEPPSRRGAESAPARPVASSAGEQAPARVNPAPRPARGETSPTDIRRPATVRPIRETDRDDAPAPVSPAAAAGRASQTAHAAEDDGDFGRAVADAPTRGAEASSTNGTSRPARLSPPRPAPRPASAARGGQDGSDEEIDMANYGWTEFWSWARARGFNDRKALDAAVGRQTTGMTPLEIRKHIQARQG